MSTCSATVSPQLARAQQKCGAAFGGIMRALVLVAVVVAADVAISDQKYYGKPPCRSDEVEFHNELLPGHTAFVPGMVCAPKCNKVEDCPPSLHPWTNKSQGFNLMQCWSFPNYTGSHCFQLSTDTAAYECPDGMIYGTRDEPPYPNDGPCLWPNSVQLV